MFTSGFHLLPFYTNDLASGASNVALGAINDQVVPITNSLYQPGQDFYLHALYAGIPDCTALRINAPSLQLPTLPYIDPLSLTALPANLPPITRFGDHGLQLQAAETISLEASRAVVAAADAYALMWLFPRPVTRAPGAVRTIRFSTAVTIAEGTWAGGSLTMTSSLQAGTYQVVGMQTYGANLLASRLLFSNQVLRPGCLGQGAQGEWNSDDFRRGNLGVWGTFTNTTVPTIEHLGVGAGSAQIGYLDIVRVGP